MASRYWVGGSGDWDASTTTHWSASSGGAGGASVPGSSDAVTFDSHSNEPDDSAFETTITADATCSNFSLNCSFATVTLSASLTVSTTGISLVNGSFDSSSYAVTTPVVTTNYGGTVSWDMGSSTYTINGTGNTIISGDGVSITAGTSTLKFTDNSSTNKTCYISKTLNNIWIATAGTGTFTFGSSGTYKDIKIDAGRTVKFSNGETNTCETFTALGTSGSHITISNTSSTTHSTLAKSGGGTISGCDYIDIQEITGSPASTWYIGANSTDTDTTCTNIYLSDPPATSTSNFFQLF